MRHFPPKPVKRVSWTRGVLVGCTRFVVTLINQILVVPSWFAIITALQPIKYLNYTWYLSIEGVMYKHLLDLVSYWAWVEGFRLYESGTDIKQYVNARCLVLPNHQSTNDIPILFGVFHNKLALSSNVMWVSDLELMFSHIGVVCLIHGDMFVRQKLGSAQREKTLKGVENHLKDKFIGRKRNWCIVFPEGGFFRKRKAPSQQYSIKKGYPVFEHLSGPRVFGVEKILQTIENNDPKRPFEYILDVIIAYQDQSRCVGLPDLVFSGRYPEDIHVHYKLYPVSDLNRDSTQSLEVSLFKIWEQKEKMLRNFYQFGYFESDDENTKLCNYSDARHLSLNAMYSFLTVFVFIPVCKFLAAKFSQR